MEVGKPKYGGGKNTFKIKDGDNVYRILPPVGKLASSGKWSQYCRVEWGYKNSKKENRPFEDCRVINFDTKMVEVESAAHLYREQLKVAKEATLELFKNGKATREQVSAAADLVKRFNQDSKHYLNVVNLNGEIGLLKIGHRAFQAIFGWDKVKRQKVGLIPDLLARGIDPIGLSDGRYFNFHRSGTGRDTIYTVTVYNENVEVNGQIYQQEKIHAIDDAFVARLEKEAFELSGMYPAPSGEEVQRIVHEGVSAIDEILGFRKQSGSNGSSKTVSSPITGVASSTPVSGQTQAAASEAAVIAAPTAAEAVAVQAAATIPTPVPQANAPVSPSLPQAAAAPQTTVPAPTPAAPAPAPATQTQPAPAGEEKTTSDMSDEEFLKHVGAV